jgi:hypothetical protein
VTQFGFSLRCICSHKKNAGDKRGNGNKQKCFHMYDRSLNLQTQISQAQKAIVNITHHVSSFTPSKNVHSPLHCSSELNRAIFAI